MGVVCCRKCIIDKNAKIGKDVIIMNKDVSISQPILNAFSLENLILLFPLICFSINFQGVQEADRPEQGFYIRSGITIVMEKATIEDGTVI